MTRARDHLRLLVPQRFHVHAQSALGDRHVYAARSRFIAESTLRCFDVCAWPPADSARADAASATPRAQASIDVTARVRDLWR
jgi:DNA helicase-2/ATP-dependent DNA helicase PcrA